MNQIEKEYFAELSKDRAESADMLEKPSMRGIKNSVVEKYSDQAHFIYELLQNADDAYAEHTRFILEHDKLIFAHDGKRQFSVSNPMTEDEDSQNGKLGDINAITSIANSNKTKASIGKFGVGFKAVFQYTDTPCIYAPEVSFRIDRFIVPTLLEEDYSLRRPNETLFVFPFDNMQRSQEEAYQDIATKIKNLSYPLLFLSCLKNIEFEFDNTKGSYIKSVDEVIQIGNAKAKKIHMTRNVDYTSDNEDMWLFSREDEDKHEYCVCFPLDENGKLRPVNKPAFCFFPTKENTGLNFIIHAPFLLTDSREGIKAGIAYNDSMIKLLADLAADSMIFLRDIGLRENTYLIDDKIFNIIPVYKSLFSDPKDKQKVSFMPFYEKIKSKFNHSRLLLSSDGYVSKQNAYWAASPRIPKIFSTNQLVEIVDNNSARWVFVDIRREELQRNNRSLFRYLDFLVRESVNESIILTGRLRDLYDRSGNRIHLGIDANFICHQSMEWLNTFYEWIAETDRRTNLIKRRPIFLNQNGEAASAYDKKNHQILFLPVNDIGPYDVINPELFKKPGTVKLAKKMEIKEPSLRDQIYNIIVPQYENENIKDIDIDSHFIKFFGYYCKCSKWSTESFINMIKDLSFISCYKNGDPAEYREPASSVYLPEDGLDDLLSNIIDLKFIDINKYKKIVGSKRKEQLKDFLNDLGIHHELKIVEVEVDGNGESGFDLPHPYSTREVTWKESVIEGLKEIMEYIVENKDVNKSYLLWNAMLKIIENNCGPGKSMNELLSGKCKYFYYHSSYETFESSDVKCLKKSKWLIDKDGEFKSPDKISLETLSERYEINSKQADELIGFLGINEKLNDVNLTDEQREKINLADKMVEFGIYNESDLEAFRKFRERKDLRRRSHRNIVEKSDYNQAGFDYETDNVDKNIDDDITGIFKSEKTYDTNYSRGNGESKAKKDHSENVDPIIRKVVRDILHADDISDRNNSNEDDNIDIDTDEFTPVPVDYKKRIKRAKERSREEIDRITLFEKLQKRADQFSRYTFGWFKIMLEMDCLNSKYTNANNRVISISFGRVEREHGTKRTLVLKYPDRHIPQFMEEVADIPMELHMGDQVKKVAIEVANINSYTLRVKMKNKDDIKGIDLNTVTCAKIDVHSPSFLIESLRDSVNDLDFDDKFNMQDNLCKNIEFIFGPPGTGKTTYLASNVLIPMVKNNDSCKVLVLTPTNKAADVLVDRIMDISGTDREYENWLVRFGTTGSEKIESSPVFHDKTFDIGTLNKNVTVTTIARFSYDFFMPPGNRIFLKEINWDYIVVDEASMIPLINMIYLLYKKKPKKFIISGDPFQIEPITTVDQWKDENIYTMVRLNSFKEPETYPYHYDVKLLTTQYRSVPVVGEVFSKFMYGGILKHYRRQESQKELNLGNDLKIKTLNILKFPVSKYESIYRCKRLSHSSSYQVYSALFTFEYVCNMSKLIAKHNPGDHFNIGIIAPYRAEADLIDRLLSSEKLPVETNVQAGTIHGFQGDECDIVFAVFNTPPKITSSPYMFLNKRNIINVSISRAKDYLFIVMPDDNTENIDDLKLIKRVESIIKGTDDWREEQTPDLEEQILGDREYLENNTFSTSHQSVNVYGLPEKCYEIRTEDSAIDIQIHR